MKIALIGFGIRGDVQPLIALGNGLQDAGHAVVIAAASDFQAMVESAGFAYAPLQTNMQALMNSESGKCGRKRAGIPSRKVAICGG